MKNNLQQPKKMISKGKSELVQIDITAMDNVYAIAKNIKLLVLDVDGVLTTGALWFTARGEEIKVFHIHDGLGIKMLLRHGIEVAIISGRKSGAVSKRMQELGLQYVYQGIDDKLAVLYELSAKLNLEYEEIAYVGDDLVDIPPMTKVGLSVAVNNAVPDVRRQAEWVTEAQGGQGAVREVCELLLKAQNLHPMM